MLFSALSMHSRFVQLTIAAVFLCIVAYFLIPNSIVLAKHLNTPSIPPPPRIPPTANHPIDQLVQIGQEEHQAIAAHETKTVHEAAEAYRKRRGRQPPPLFDLWFEFAANHSAVVIEDFFDQIYHDTNPFWGIPAKQIREQANSFLHRISVRNGKATPQTDIPLRDRPWMGLWTEMVESVAQWLPDLDMPINVMDESRIVVPWEEIDEYMRRAGPTVKIVPAEGLKTTYATLKESIKALDEETAPEFDPGFSGGVPYWTLAVVGCHPDSPARKAYIETEFTSPPPMSDGFPKNTFHGYVQNWTFVQDPCQHPKIQSLHGTFVEPISIANTKVLFPLFGGSKLPMNNEILLPPAMYWTKDPFYSGGDTHGGPWEEKEEKLVWRGSSTGGRNKAENWTRFQRHRFISMMNATNIKQVEQDPKEKPINFVLPAKNTYDLTVQKPDMPEHAFSDWVASWADAASVHLLCFPNDVGSATCPYTDPYFTVKKAMPMKKQYRYKYLPDIDGNSFSGRYRGFLGSTSLPIKATIYQEWHDSRLTPWKHFVPMDNTFIDIYGIMEYFVGNKLIGLGGHDEVAKTIALDGKAWAEKVLRPEDMSLYVFRLLLEYARLCDDDRDRMGWAEARDVP